MVSFFEKILEERGSVGFGGNPEKIIKERENLKGIFDKILENLDDLENKKKY